MKWQRVFQMTAFLLASVLEVRVHAEEIVSLPETKAPIEVPSNCIIESSICTIKTLAKQRYTLKMEAVDVVLAESSAFTRLSASSGSLITGYVYIKTDGIFKIETPYGRVSSDQGEFLIYSNANTIMVRNISGSVVMEPKAHASMLELEEGYENWMGRVDVTGKATVGIPKSLSYKETIEDLAALYNGTPKEFGMSMKQLRHSWQDAVYASSLSHGAIVQRELASQEEKKKRKLAIQRKWQEERDYLRDLLFKKTFE